LKWIVGRPPNAAELAISVACRAGSLWDTTWPFPVLSSMLTTYCPLVTMLSARSHHLQPACVHPRRLAARQRCDQRDREG
jgi:hypothetical protein